MNEVKYRMKLRERIFLDRASVYMSILGQEKTMIWGDL